MRLPARYRELDRDPAFPRREWKALAQRGWLGPRVGKDRGGAGWSLLEEAALLEELSFEAGSVFAKLVLQPEFCSPLQRGGEALIDRWYRPLLRGEVLVGNQVTEPSAGSDAAALETTVRTQGSESILSGTKSQIAFAADADAAIVYARTSSGPGAAGISAFLVPQSLPGVQREPGRDLGEKWMRRGTVRYENVQLPPGSRIGEEGQGFYYLMEELTHERALLAVIYLAVARRSWEEVRVHVMERKAFDRPLGSFEGVSFPLVEDYVRLESARLFAWEVLRRIEAGQRSDGDSALSKMWANAVALEAVEHAMQFHGGEGYSESLPHEQRWRDLRSGTVAHGSTEVLKIVAARELLGRESVPYGRRGSKAPGATPARP
jgi:cyclohexanecarboxyl-CoA dehydrogenase